MTVFFSQGTSLLQIGWPIVLLVVIVTIRNMYPVEDVKECKFFLQLKN